MSMNPEDKARVRRSVRDQERRSVMTVESAFEDVRKSLVHSPKCSVRLLHRIEGREDMSREQIQQEMKEVCVCSHRSLTTIEAAYREMQQRVVALSGPEGWTNDLVVERDALKARNAELEAFQVQVYEHSESGTISALRSRNAELEAAVDQAIDCLTGACIYLHGGTDEDIAHRLRAALAKEKS